ncbi:MAG: PAS domain-containing protein, partial [Thermoanaerobaculia bacterium]
HLSAAAFPIRRDGVTTAALSVFASEADVFGPQELELLAEAAVDVAFGLQHIEMQAARVQAERAMRLWTDAFRYCGHGIAIGDPRKESVLACNPAYAAIVRRTVDEICSTPISALYTPLSNARLHEAMAQSDRTGSASREVEMLRSDGSSVPVQLDLVSVRDHSGAVAYRVATVQDITETALAKASLRDYAQRFQLAVASERLGVYDWNVRTDGLVWDERMYEMHGVARQTFEPSLEAWRAMIHPDDREGTAEAVTRSLAGDAAFDTEFRIVRPDGSIVHVKANATIIRDASGAAARMVGVNRDVTAERHAAAERIAIEAQLLHAQKMEAIGTLAAGVAHDFNNILMPMIGHAELAIMNAHDENAVREEAAHIIESGERARDIIRQILAIARRTDSGTLVPVNVGILLSETMRFLRASLPATIAMKADVDPACGAVLADVSQIQQVILNLCTNARDAMAEHGGVLEVSLDRVAGSPPAGSESGNALSWLRLSVRDTGPGIDPSIIDRIFEPYFTTKTRDKGTGLGLAVTQRIVAALGGEVRVSSIPGEGARFEVLLPEAGHAREKHARKDLSVPRGNGECVLLVEDEQPILHVLGRTVTALGYRVLTCSSGAEALDLFLNPPQPIDVVVTDNSMPGMTGIELAHTLLRLRPELPIVLSTGYADEQEEELLRAAGVRVVLLKPYATATLASTLREVLGSRSKDDERR